MWRVMDSSRQVAAFKVESSGTAPLVVFLSGGIRIFNRIVSHPLLQLAESLGAAGYAIIGISGLFCGAAWHF